MNWPVHARVDFTVSAIPAPNSIMCIPPNHNGAGPQGHVAFVTGPVVNGHVPVIEMNFLIDHGYSYRSAPVGGCEFIHLVPKPVPPDPPSTKKGMPAMFLYQAANGTIYLCMGGVKLTFTSIADVQKYQNNSVDPVALYTASEFTTEWNAEIAKLTTL